MFNDIFNSVSNIANEINNLQGQNSQKRMNSTSFKKNNYKNKFGKVTKDIKDVVSSVDDIFHNRRFF